MEESMRKNSTDKNEKNIHQQHQKGNATDNIDALRFDGDDIAVTKETPEESAVFEAFMAEYRTLIKDNKNDEDPGEEITVADEKEFLLSLPRKKAGKSSGKKDTPSPVKKREDWDEEITLEPGVYEDLDEEGKQLLDETPAEEEVIPDFNLGEKSDESDDKFQISINFEGENKQDVLEDEPQEKEKKYDPEKPRAIDWIFDFAEMMVFVLLTVFILTSFVFKHARVEGDSMNNTLQSSDHLIISDLFYTPKRGDIIVFDGSNKFSESHVIVKRIIGLPGDTVEIKLTDKGEIIAYVNGKPLDGEEDYAYHSKIGAATLCKPVTVGEGEVFVMGDNRYNSLDSRLIGTINMDAILGKVLFRIYPFSSFGKVD